MDKKANAKPEVKKTAVIVTVVVGFLLLIIPVMAFWIVLIFAAYKTHFLALIMGLSLVALSGAAAFSLSNKGAGKKYIVFCALPIAVCALILGAETYYKDSYLPSITVRQTYFDYNDYLPFSGSELLTRLSSPADLHFSETDELPIIDGATALVPVYCSFVQAVYPETLDIEKYVHFNKTSGAYKELIEGMCDIIFVAQPSQKQIEAAQQHGAELNMYPIGYEAFVFLVNKKNPVSDLSVRQIKDIYTGKITNWKQLGGKNLTIRTFQRDEGSGSQTAFLALMGKETELLSPETHKVFGMDGLVDVVSDYQNHAGAIGYSFRYYVETMKKNPGVKMLSLNGIEPTAENIKNKTYPVTDNFYAITVKGKESENAKRFIEWILSAQGQQIIADVGYVPLE